VSSVVRFKPPRRADVCPLTRLGDLSRLAPPVAPRSEPPTLPSSSRIGLGALLMVSELGKAFRESLRSALVARCSKQDMCLVRIPETCTSHAYEPRRFLSRVDSCIGSLTGPNRAVYRRRLRGFIVSSASVRRYERKEADTCTNRAVARGINGIASRQIHPCAGLRARLATVCRPLGIVKTVAVCSDADMSQPSTRPTLYKGYRFPAEIISRAVWRYYRFGVSLRTCPS
jgi:hypothetical protein